MRILFVENKHVTATWEALTPRLEREGDEIHWLVQNPLWAPSVGSVHPIPFPGKKDYRRPSSDAFERIAHQDRGINYFGGDDRHYEYYAEQIARVIDDVEPDVVVGESTLFHEQLAMQICKARHTPYLFPTGIRYPVDRIGFLVADTQELAFGSGDTLPKEQVDALLAVYEKRGQVPLFYAHLGKMNPARRLRLVARALGKGLTALRSRLLGERFNTPSLLHKARAERHKAALKRAWDEAAAQKAQLRGRTSVLFPLQMLPESTLECWGYEWRDQLDALRRLVEASDEETIFLIKTNPVPRYEITSAFVEFVRTHPRVRPLPSTTKMDDIFWTADLIATVTGTVALEAFLTGKPFVTLSYSFATRFAPGNTLIRPEELADVIGSIRAGTWPVSGAAERRRFLEHQIASSHQAVMGDPHYYPPVIEPGNLDRLAAAFRFVRRAVDEGRAWEECRAAEA